VSGHLHAPAALHSGKESPVPIGQSAGWAPESVWVWRGENSWPYRDSNSDPSAVQPVTSRYPDSYINNVQYKWSNFIFQACTLLEVQNIWKVQVWIFIRIPVSVQCDVPVLSRVVGCHPGTFSKNSDEKHRCRSLRGSETPSPNTRYGIRLSRKLQKL
jgi:hypothetical protein